MISGAIAFVSSPFGLTFAGMLAGLAVVVWDWRFSLGALFAVQAAMGAATVHLYQTPVQWVLIQTAVMGLSCIILGMSASKTMRYSPTGRQSGSLALRVVAVLLLYGGWRLLDVQVTLPGLDADIAQLSGWVAICALLTLALGANPLFAGTAFLLWIVPTQAFVATVLQIPSLVALLGILELMTALACSYLLVAESIRVTQKAPIITDVAFPSLIAFVQESSGERAMHGSFGSAVTRRIADWAARGAAAGSEDALSRPAAPANRTDPASENRATSVEGS